MAQTWPPNVYIKPDRGETILALGIIGLVIEVVTLIYGSLFGCCCCCFPGPIFGLAAWLMGNSDLEEMDQGRMDAAGRSNTNMGRILGMITTITGIVSLVIFIIMAFLAMIVGLVIWGAVMKGP
jgi:hypothetical protein